MEERTDGAEEERPEAATFRCKYGEGIRPGNQCSAVRPED